MYAVEAFRNIGMSSMFVRAEDIRTATSRHSRLDTSMSEMIRRRSASVIGVSGMVSIDQVDVDSSSQRSEAINVSTRSTSASPSDAISSQVVST